MKILSALLGATLCSPAVVQAQAWPSHQVRIVVPYAAGSTPDSIARLIFDRVQKATGKAMVIDNKPGASGMIGTDQVAKATPDGYTLVLGPAGPLATNALLYKKMSYDPVKNLVPVALVAETPTILVASNATPVNDAGALLKAMADPKSRLTYGSPGAGTLGHLNMAYLASRASGGDVAHAPYGGSPQIVTALIANDIQLAALPPLAVAPFVKSGKIKAIATIGPRRSSALPERRPT
jgi:tripartite-type tricarboxylate transporter receptor subunit TctC